ncbi:MAG: hypothetical protein WCA07_02635 [Gloeobacterales cyanobacterium]
MADNHESKQKVTLYLPQELHRKLKIRSAVDDLPMSALAEEALLFYLQHPDVVENKMGMAHQIYSCPQCDTSLILRDHELRTLPRPQQVQEEALETEQKEQLVTC